jgi:putative ABC transport system ATP-binding protein
MGTVSKAKLARMRNEKMGFVMQDFALIPQMSVEDNIAVPLYIRHCKKKEIKEKTEGIAEKLDIKELLKKKVSQLSGGQCQRVAIARAVIGNPQVILADEPTGALDQANGEKVLDVLREINKNGTTIIITTHDEDVAKKCDRILMIEDGKIEEYLQSSN